MIKFKRIVCAASAAVLLGAGGLANAATAVFTELALLMDTSGSVDANEFNLQRGGYVNAFLNPILHGFIAATPGGVAVTMVQWSGDSQQYQIGGGTGGWYHLTDAASSIGFANALAGFNRVSPFNLTAPGSAINFIVPQFSTNAFDGQNWIIDVSGDGEQNDGANTATARNNALAAGVDRINGLAIGNVALLNWYNANIVGGSGGFALQAADFAAFENAVFNKLRYEITNTVIPVPGALPLLASGLLAFGWLARRRKA